MPENEKKVYDPEGTLPNQGVMGAQTFKKTVQKKLRNPLEGMTEEDCLADVDRWVEARGLGEHRETFRKGGLVARVQFENDGFERVGLLNDADKQILRDEITHKWRHPFALYFLCVLCAG